MPDEHLGGYPVVRCRLCGDPLLFGLRIVNGQVVSRVPVEPGAVVYLMLHCDGQQMPQAVTARELLEKLDHIQLTDGRRIRPLGILGFFVAHHAVCEPYHKAVKQNAGTAGGKECT